MKNYDVRIDHNMITSELTYLPFWDRKLFATAVKITQEQAYFLTEQTYGEYYLGNKYALPVGFKFLYRHDYTYYVLTPAEGVEIKEAQTVYSSLNTNLDKP